MDVNSQTPILGCRLTTEKQKVWRNDNAELIDSQHFHLEASDKVIRETWFPWWVGLEITRYYIPQQLATENWKCNWNALWDNRSHCLELLDKAMTGRWLSESWGKGSRHTVHHHSYAKYNHKGILMSQTIPSFWKYEIKISWQHHRLADDKSY